ACASSISMKVVSDSTLTSAIGSIWTATFSMGGPCKVRSLSGPRSVQAQHDAGLGGGAAGGGAAVEVVGAVQRLQGAGQGPLALAGGGHVQPRAVVAGVQQGAAKGGALGALVVVGPQGAVEHHVLQPDQGAAVADRGH